MLYVFDFLPLAVDKSESDKESLEVLVDSLEESEPLEELDSIFDLLRSLCFLCLRSFRSFFFAFALAFFLFSFSRCFLFLAPSFGKRFPSLSNSTMAFENSYATTPRGTSSVLALVIDSTILVSFRTHFGAPLRFLSLLISSLNRRGT